MQNNKYKFLKLIISFYYNISCRIFCLILVPKNARAKK